MTTAGRKYMKKLGLIVNPIAGLGGAVGLKGTDGAAAVRSALEMGAVPRAASRAAEALRQLAHLRRQCQLLTYPPPMGEDAARMAAFSPAVIGSVASESTSREDTLRAADSMMEQAVDLILFAGGDGTARDLCCAVGDRIPVLGVPAGVKVHSGVYATTPASAGLAAAEFLSAEHPQTRLGEVMDIDEDAFRRGRMEARLYGYLRIPDDASRVQAAKSPSAGDEADAVMSIGAEVADSILDGQLYILGPGTTTKGVADALGVPKTLLGVDALIGRKIAALDATESQLMELLNGGRPAKIVVTPIGGQGHVFGRGNQQISADVIRRVGPDNVIVVATRRKLASLRRRLIMVDTGDPDLDRMLHGYIEVTTGRAESAMVRISD